MTKKISGLKITIKITKPNGTVVKYRSAKTRRILAKVKANNFSKVYLKVDYGNDYYNDGNYESKTELLKAFSAFTKNPLVKNII
ncbi:hypothetical protein A3F62_04865 [Candidatus Woesebacteria bacterium RIFCSPHIGHO2_12_FULL_44_11]|nr:MAG: hypothetical protein A3F62_04865 [Candidatus Woesebacteria bacterium RIFCSPHIGHO2_12_FULL_44_11]